jgi:hypothetical protein
MTTRNFKLSFLKTTITGALLLYGLGSWCQSVEASFSKSKLPPVIFINTQQINYAITYLDVNNVASISIVKDTLNKTGGFIYITMKNPSRLPLTLFDITRAQGATGAKKILYIIDDKVILDTSNIRIDSSIIVDVQNVNSSDISYLGTSTDAFDILLISTIYKFNQPKKGEKQIRLQ